MLRVSAPGQKPKICKRLYSKPQAKGFSRLSLIPNPEQKCRPWPKKRAAVVAPPRFEQSNGGASWFISENFPDGKRKFGLCIVRRSVPIQIKVEPGCDEARIEAHQSGCERQFSA